ncbi:MAG: bifunctional DNA-formamidopyrimidine glycosylase/DNA-(apurinic or apyrimidinic site) lyase [Phycisphaeraceae bacterium]|nr:bifunctional DNA-formamidopyrimidine glycosylase/DNA-(apurinic or apyrimidinic site) lyase [Phycisphaeraceae bacterium]
MPELPEVEHLRRSLEPILLGRTVRSVLVRNRRVIVAPGDPPGGWGRSRSTTTPVPLQRRALFEGLRIEHLKRHGKHLAIVTNDGPAIDVHLGMTGSLRVIGGDPPPHVHVVWALDDNSRLAFIDPRRFGGLWTFDTFDALHESRWGRLGPDALAIRAKALARALAGSSRAIKGALLDQSVLAGVGNIYADESLFAARIAPVRPAAALSANDCATLASEIRRVLRTATRHGGSTIRSYADASDRAGRAQLIHRVYGRAGLPCLRCDALLEAATIGQRTTVWCPRCQAR